MEFWTQARPLALTSRYLRHGAHHHDGERIVVECCFGRASALRMSATKILWGQLLFVSMVVVAFLWAATEWAAWRLAFQPQLGPAWFVIGHWPVYQPLAFFICGSSSTPTHRRVSLRAGASPQVVGSQPWLLPSPARSGARRKPKT